MAAARAVDLVARKRDREALSADELAFLVRGYLDGSVAEGQMAAFLMAGVLNGFSRAEALALTEVLWHSGEQLDLSDLSGPTIDKHSTGGVGDGTSLLVAPLLAAAGAQLVKLSGRGLGHTGGTLDKLESIPGLRVGLSVDEMLRVVREVGCVVAAQTERIVPADRALYALRDVTATVAEPALIASSVMSKKLAAGAATIVLDVKAGDGAFLPDMGAAEELARLCVQIGADAGRRCLALVTAMDQPLGRGIGNALEVRECIELLQRPPAGRLAELALELAVAALAAAGRRDRREVEAELRRRWESGEALERLRRMVAAQGGEPRVCDAPADVLPSAPVRREIAAGSAGVVTAMPARRVGEISGLLGAGRARKEDAVDPAVGLDLLVEVGDRVDEQTPVVVVHARDDATAEEAARRFLANLEIGEGPVERPATVLGAVGG